MPLGQTRGGRSALRLVPDVAPTVQELHAQRATELIATDHAGRPEAAATADTAAMLAKVFAAARREPPHPHE